MVGNPIDEPDARMLNVSICVKQLRADHAHLGSTCSAYHRVEPTRRNFRVVVQKKQKRTGGSLRALVASASKTLISRIRNQLQPAGGLLLLQESRRAVSGRIVHNYQLKTSGRRVSKDRP